MRDTAWAVGCVWQLRTMRQHAAWLPCLRDLLRLLLHTALPAPQVQERQNRVCTTVAIAIVAETCAPFTVLPALMNEYKVRARVGRLLGVCVCCDLPAACRCLPAAFSPPCLPPCPL